MSIYTRLWLLGGACTVTAAAFAQVAPPPDAFSRLPRASQVDGQGVPAELQDSEIDAWREIRLDGTAARVGSFERFGRVLRLYGEAFSHGATPEASAEAFLAGNAPVLGLDHLDMVPIPELHNQPIMYLRESGTFKFTGLNYRQVRGGLPVFRSRLMLLVRNEPGYPLVLASADVRDLADFMPDPQVVLAATPNAAQAAAMRAVPGLDQFRDAEMVIYAGVDDTVVEPRESWVFLAGRGQVTDPDHGWWLFVVDARTNRVLFSESQIFHVDVNGVTQGVATQGIGADFCGPVATELMPHARAFIGATNVFSNAFGQFTVPNPGNQQVTVTGNLQGRYFRVTNQAGSNTSAQQTLFPPGPAMLTFNPINSNEFVRAEVNAFLHANLLRDFVLYYNPSYPTVSTQLDMAVNVNLDNNCNAFYSPAEQSINFYTSGGGCANTAFSTVVYHEFGHHLIQMAGSGQGAYGEGMSDCVAVIMSDDPGLGYGFNSGCGTPLRNADNDCQYSAANCTTNCGSAIHSCGRLMSGCVWDLRNQLLSTHPATYRDILSSLTINSILLHTGTAINPAITIDFLTLDDDDANINNGTPHYAQIAAAFGAHNMPAPPLAAISLELTATTPACVRPDGGTSLEINIVPVAGTLNGGTAQFFYSTGGAFSSIPLNAAGGTLFTVNVPATPCLTDVRYYFRAQGSNGTFYTLPANAPTATFGSISGYDCDAVFSDDFETNQGWSVTNSGGLTDGAWDRGIPIPWTVCNRGNPNSDADGSGRCYLTDNSSANNCNSDVDNGRTSLISPIIDATGESYVSYWRWYSNTAGSNPNVDIFEVFVSSNGGSTWTALEVVGPGGPQANGGWNFRRFRIADFVTPSSQFRIRFDASDLGPQAVVEAAVDGVSVLTLSCELPCPGDLDGDGDVGFNDVLDLLSAWGPCAGCAADIDGSGTVDFSDLLTLLSAWGPCE